MSRYAVLGPGGVGGLLAVLLEDAGHEVVVIAREPDPLRERGFRLSSALFGERRAHPDVVAVLDRDVDAVFVTPKATVLEEALRALPEATVGEALVVPFLNGVDHMSLLRSRYARVVAGVIRVESARTAPGVIEHTSGFARVELAAAGDLAGPARRVVTDLAAAGLAADLVADEQAALWGKLAFLAPFALLTTAHRAPVGTIREEHPEEMRTVIAEVTAVACAEGGPCDPQPTLDTFEGLDAQMRSSMLRDAEAGAPLELDAIGGAVLRAARAHGIPIPRTEALVARLGDASD